MARFNLRFSWQFESPEEVRIPLGLLFLSTLVTALFALTYYFRFPPEFPLFYTLATPSQQLVAREWLFFFPLFSLVITGLHTFIALRLPRTQLLLMQLFVWTSVFVQLLILLALVRSIMLVT